MFICLSVYSLKSKRWIDMHQIYSEPNKIKRKFKNLGEGTYITPPKRNCH